MGQHPVVQVYAKDLQLGLAQTIMDELLDGGPLRPGVVIPLKQQLKRHLPGTRTSSHNGIRSRSCVLLFMVVNEGQVHSGGGSKLKSSTFSVEKFKVSTSEAQSCRMKIEQRQCV